MVLSKHFWKVLMRPAVLPFFILAVVDCGMTVYGTSRAIGGPPMGSMVVGLIVGCGILITLLSTFDIWGSWHPVLRESAIMSLLLRTIWVVAFLYDWATSAVAIFDIAGLDKQSLNLSELMRLGAGIVAGLVMCGATLVVSFMAYNERREEMAET